MVGHIYFDIVTLVTKIYFQQTAQHLPLFHFQIKNWLNLVILVCLWIKFNILSDIAFKNAILFLTHRKIQCICTASRRKKNSAGQNFCMSSWTFSSLVQEFYFLIIREIIISFYHYLYGWNVSTHSSEIKCSCLMKLPFGTL